MKIKTTSEEIVGFLDVYAHLINPELIDSSEYFKDVICDWYRRQAPDSTFYYLYVYTNCHTIHLPYPDDSSKEMEINQVCGPYKSIPLNDVVEIEHIETKYFQENLDIVNCSNMENADWINTKPIDIIFFGGGLCSYTIYLFQALEDTTIKQWEKLIEMDDAARNAQMDGKKIKEGDDTRFIEELTKPENRKLKIVILRSCLC